MIIAKKKLAKKAAVKKQPALTTVQKRFLDSIDVPEVKTFNASSYSTAEYKAIMSVSDLWVAYGVTPCKAQGHTLRTRAGHCIQCDPKKIAFLKRHSESQYVYLAHSKKTKLIKIGVTSDLYMRESTLNKQSYGGVNDWKIISSAFVYNSGVAESQIHRLLVDYKKSSHTFKDGAYSATRELFSCPQKTALMHFRKIVSHI
jgi:hypothetical protein